MIWDTTAHYTLISQEILSQSSRNTSEIQFATPSLKSWSSWLRKRQSRVSKVPRHVVLSRKNCGISRLGSMICGKKHDNEIKDIPLLIVPSAQDLALHGAKRLDIPIQSVNPELRAKPRFIKPDYSHPDRQWHGPRPGPQYPTMADINYAKDPFIQRRRLQ